MRPWRRVGLVLMVRAEVRFASRAGADNRDEPPGLLGDTMPAEDLLEMLGDFEDPDGYEPPPTAA